jgi:hypothetical protein
MQETSRASARSAAWGVVAVISGGAAAAAWIAAISPGSKLSAWPAWVLTALAAAAVYRCFSPLSPRPLASRHKLHSRSADPARLTQTNRMDLLSEQADNCLRLGMSNLGAAAEFSAQVTGILDPLGRAVGLQHWPIPWLEDGSPEPKRILTGQTRMLDFARYDPAAVNAELSAGSGGATHWWFSSVPVPIGAKYYNLRSQADLTDQHITLTVRIMNAHSGDYFDRQLMLGIKDSQITCELVEDEPS